MFKFAYFFATTVVLLTTTACSKKSDDAPPVVKPVVSFSVRFDSSGPDSWSRSYTEAECSAPPIQDFTGKRILLSFKAFPVSGDVCNVEVMAMSKTDLLPGVVGIYDGDGLFKVELEFRPKDFSCYIPSVAYRNQHGTPYTFTINSYDAATKRASGTFDLDLGGQANPALCPQQGFGRVRAQGTFRNVVLPY